MHRRFSLEDVAHAVSEATGKWLDPAEIRAEFDRGYIQARSLAAGLTSLEADCAFAYFAALACCRGQSDTSFEFRNRLAGAARAACIRFQHDPS